MKFILFLFVQLFSMACNNAGKLAAQTTPVQYKLVWFDEFTTDGVPDPENGNLKMALYEMKKHNGINRKMRFAKTGILLLLERRNTSPIQTIYKEVRIGKQTGRLLSTLLQVW